MVTLPVVTNYSQVRNVRTTTGESTRSPSAEIGAWREVSRQADAVNEFATRIRDANIAADVSAAEIRLKSREAAVLKSLEEDGDGDPATFQDRYTAAMQAVMAEQEEGLTSPLARRMWQARTGGTIEDGVIRVGGLARQKQIDQAKAKFTKNAAKLKTSADAFVDDKSITFEDLDKQHQSYIDSLLTAKRTGILTDQEATALVLSSEEIIRDGKQQRHGVELERLIDAGSYDEAEAYLAQHEKEMTVQQRQALRDVLDGKQRLKERLDKADMLWTDSGGDYANAMAAAGTIDDPEERLAIESRLEEKRLQDDRAQAEQREVQGEIMDQGFEHILFNRNPLQALSANQLSQLTGSQKLQLQDEYRKRLAPPVGETAEDRRYRTELSSYNASAILELAADTTDQLSMEFFASGPESWEAEADSGNEYAVSVWELYSSLEPADKMKVRMESRKARAAVNEGKDYNLSGERVDKIVRNTSELLDVYFPRGIKQAGLFGSYLFGSYPRSKYESLLGKDKDALESIEMQYKVNLRQVVVEWAEENPDKNPTEAERKAFIRDAAFRTEPDRFKPSWYLKVKDLLIRKNMSHSDEEIIAYAMRIGLIKEEDATDAP